MSTYPCAVSADLSREALKQEKADEQQRDIDTLFKLFSEDLTELQDRMPVWRMNSLTTFIFEEANACQAGRQSYAEMGESIMDYFEKEKAFIAEREIVG